MKLFWACPPLFGDAISLSPGEIVLDTMEENLPLILIVVLLIVTALLVRRFTRKK